MRNTSFRKNFLRSQKMASKRRSGQTVVIFALMLTILIGIAAYVIDEGIWLQRKAHLQKAADFAALAGAAILAQKTEGQADATAFALAITTATNFATSNGYTNGANNATVSITNDSTNKKLTVIISIPGGTYFGGIFRNSGVTLKTKAVAQYTYSTAVDLSVTGGTYGTNSGPINLGLYGPDQITERGDLYSAKWARQSTNGTFFGDNSGTVFKPNPQYRSSGYQFYVDVPRTFGSQAIIQIYDPDSYDSGSDSTSGNKVWDEGNKDSYTGTTTATVTGTNVTTVTRYSVYNDNGTPTNYADDTLIASQDIGADSTKDKKWDNTLTFDPTAQRTSETVSKQINFRLQVQTISGCNENGFNVRVAKPTDTDATFSGGGNGTSVSGMGDLPVNFGATGTGNVRLGYVPAGATTVTIKHFDSDTGVTAGTYVNYSNDGTGETGKIYHGTPLLGGNSNNVMETDTLTLPANYPGGNWTAQYSAGASDNTTWSMAYSGPGNNSPGTVRLVE